mgnify:CR=1 FL=1
MTGRGENSSLILHQVKQINKMVEIMRIKLKIMTTLLGLVFGCGIAASQTPRAEQTMNSKRQYIAEVAALTSMGHLDQLRTVLIGGLNSGITVSELK